MKSLRWQGWNTMSPQRTHRHRKTPLEVGSSGTDGAWRPFVGQYHLRIVCHVRNAPVRACRLASRGALNPPPPGISESIYDEDCEESETDGFFQHPELPSVVRIPNARCARFWIEFEYGKWIWPKLAGNIFKRLNPTVNEATTRIFATNFDEACDWV
jgi:hypothetical protein